MNTPTHIITHHSASPNTFKVKDVDAWHKIRWPEFRSSIGWWVGYHYVIEADGTITQTRREDEEGAHCIGMNRSSIGVCFMGNFDNTRPTAAQLQAWIRLYNDIQFRWKIPPERVVPHRRYANKSCPGALLSDTYFAEQVAAEQVQTIRSLRAQLLRLQSLFTKKRMSKREK